MKRRGHQARSGTWEAAERLARQALAALTASARDGGDGGAPLAETSSSSGEDISGGSGDEEEARRGSESRRPWRDFERLEERRQREWLFRRHRPSRAGWNRD